MISNNKTKRYIIEARQGLFEFDWQEIWAYRDLLGLLVRRDLISNYKQTVLGPAWFLIQPLLTTLTFTVIFGRVAKISTNETPPFLFYMCSTLMWNYFQNCMNSVATSLTANANLLRKVYFPRLITPLSIVASNLAQFLLNMVLFTGFYVYFLAQGTPNIQPTTWLFAMPVVVVQSACIGLGVGLWFSAVTIRYRDLRFAINFIAQLWMYATPIVYPAELVPNGLRWLLFINPMASIVEQTRMAFLGVGYLDATLVTSGWLVTLIMLGTGLLVFNKAQRNFVDMI